jgi:hypothetical protein
VRQALVRVGTRHFKRTLWIVSGDRREGLRSNGVLVHGMILGHVFADGNFIADRKLEADGFSCREQIEQQPIGSPFTWPR